MRIEKIYLRHIGPFEEITIDLPKGNDPKRADTYIFTGLNGSGKSTILYAVAAALGAGVSNTGEEHISRRMWDDRSLAAISVDGEIVIVSKNTSEIDLINPLLKYENVESFTSFASSSFVTLRTVLKSNIRQNLHEIESFNRKYEERGVTVSHSFTPVFAYAGYRTFESYKLNAIQDLTQSPLANSLSFIKIGSTQQIAQWIANTDYKEAIYRRNGDHVKADQQKAAIERINTAISEISGINLRFVVNIDPINVLVKQNNTETTLDLLPDGLKAISSFLADLLMRLDRLPLHPDYLNPLDRPFILLLDEIEIHLHAKWQRQVLPVVQKLFPNAQILLSTHSPFVVGSAFDAHIIQLKTEGGKTTGYELFDTQVGQSYDAILRLIFDLTERFDPDTERRYREFEQLGDAVLANKADFDRDLLPMAQQLASVSLEVGDLVAIKVNQIRRQMKLTVRK